MLSWNQSLEKEHLIIHGPPKALHEMSCSGKDWEAKVNSMNEASSDMRLLYSTSQLKEMITGIYASAGT